MQLTSILLLACSITLSAKTVSQTITYSGKNVKLEKIFQVIKQQTGYLVTYNPDNLKEAELIDIKAKEVPVATFLSKVLKDQPFEFTIEGNTIFIRKASMADVDDKFVNNEDSGPVKGRVVNEKGEPVEGVSVTVKGSNIGTSTNVNGEFYLEDIDDNATLIFTHTSIEKLEQKRNGRQELTIGVKVRSSILDEVQVIPYGTQKKRFSVGNVTTVKGDDIGKQPVNNPLLALQGRVPGLFVTQNTGVPGGAVTVRIQGQNSIANGNEPFYVIDGVPFYDRLVSVGAEGVIRGGNPLNFINTADIESIEVLKDADATAIYGSRAANGAILITTKKGKAGRTAFEFNIQHGWGKVTRKMDMLNRRQYLDMRYEAFANDSIDWTDPNVSANDLKLWDTTRETDWQKELIGGTAQYSNVNIGLSGGNSGIQYIVGGTWHRETTVFPLSASDIRGSLHLNLNSSSSNEKLRFQFTGNYLADVNRLPLEDFTLPAVRLEPVAPTLYNSDGKLNWAQDASGTSTWTNPLANRLYSTYRNNTNSLISHAVMSYTAMPGLNIQTSAGYTNMKTTTYSPLFLGANRPEDLPFAERTAVYGNRSLTSWNIEPQITYNTTLAKGKLESLFGISVQQSNSEGQTLLGRGYSSDLVLEDMRSAATISIFQGLFSLYKYNAVFGRLHYNWRDKYIIHAAGRRDGSSRFGAKSRFHNFGSVGMAWLFAEERFIKESFSFLSFGKIRGTYGSTGNDRINDYTFLSLYERNIGEFVPYQNSAGLTTVNLSNPYVQWEETRKLQLGIDFGFFKDRIMVNTTYARNRSSNQLLSYQLPSFTGFDNVSSNFPATVQNSSWEFAINTTNANTRRLKSQSAINLTIPKNELIEFPDMTTSSYANQLIIGQPIAIVKAYDFAGVDPETGLYNFTDHEGKLTTNPKSATDRTVLISTLPKFYGGFQNTFSYDGFELDFLIQFVKQKSRSIYFNSDLFPPGSFQGGNSNQPVTVLDRWQKPGDSKPIMRYSSDRFALLGMVSTARGSDAGYADASFIRLKNVSFSWNVRSAWQKRLHLKNCKIYFQGQNIFTFTRYKGMDPENQTINSLPPLRVLTVGVMATL